MTERSERKRGENTKEKKRLNETLDDHGMTIQVVSKRKWTAKHLTCEQNSIKTKLLTNKVAFKFEPNKMISILPKELLTSFC